MFIVVVLCVFVSVPQARPKDIENAEVSRRVWRRVASRAYRRPAYQKATSRELVRLSLYVSLSIPYGRDKHTKR